MLGLADQALGKDFSSDSPCKDECGECNREQSLHCLAAAAFRGAAGPRLSVPERAWLRQQARLKWSVLG